MLSEISSVAVGNQERVCFSIPTRGDLYSFATVGGFLVLFAQFNCCSKMPDRAFL